MCRSMRIPSLATLLACPVVLAGVFAFAAGEEPSVGEKPTRDEEPTEPEHAAQPELSPEMATLRKAVRNVLALIGKQPFNARDHTPAEIIQFCLAFGCDTRIGYDGPSSTKASAIGCLCWSYPCAGYTLLRTSGSRIMPRIGYALQARPSQFLAVLAQSRVPLDYEIRVGERRGTVADLVEFEKLSVRSGDDLSSTLIGLVHYLEEEQSWENDLGEEWSLERLIREELGRSANTSDSEVTDRLMGLSYAVDRQAEREQSLEGQFLLAQQHVSEFHDYALSLQNSDGSWHPSFFARKGTTGDTIGTLRSTGHILEWLVFSLPEDQLKGPRVARSVAYVTALLGSQRVGRSVASMSTQDIDSVMHAAHALRIYDRRVFKPLAPREPEAEEAEALTQRKTPE